MNGDRRESDTFVAFTDGDQQAATLLRDNLARLRDLLGQPGSPVPDRAAAEALRHDISDVLDGGRSMRDLAESPTFVRVAERGMHEAHRAWQELSADQRAAQLRAGRALDDAR